MKILNLAFIGLLIVLLVALPTVAEAHGGFGVGAIFGLGLGFLTGLAFAPGPAYVASPVYYPPPPVGYVYEPSYYGPGPAAPRQEVYGNHESSKVSSFTVPLTGQARCREWGMINRHWENKWDPYYGKWGWAAVRCN